MKNVILLFAFAIVATCSVSFISDTPELLIPGRGIENYVTVDATTKTAIKTKYGAGGREIKHYTTSIGTGSKSLYSIELAYKKQGVSFYFRPDSDTVFSIKVYSPFKGKTDKGIVLGTSTMQDVKSAYGSTDWIFTDKEMFLEYPGINFRIPYTGKFPVPQKVMDDALTKKVNVISITGIKE